jgi:hypothetical protein
MWKPTHGNLAVSIFHSIVISTYLIYFWTDFFPEKLHVIRLHLGSVRNLQDIVVPHVDSRAAETIAGHFFTSLFNAFSSSRLLLCGGEKSCTASPLLLLAQGAAWLGAMRLH